MTAESQEALALEDYLKNRYGERSLSRAREVIRLFPTMQEFATSTQGEWVKKFAEARPGAKRSIARGTFLVLADARSFIRERNIKLKMNEQGPAGREFISRTQLQKLVDLMCVLDIDRVDIGNVKSFVSAFLLKGGENA